MCGIAGIISLDNSKIDSTIVDNVKRSLEHRGPDHSSSKFINQSTCLIHTRLSIIDLNDRSNQPFESTDQRYSIVFNGEIYNYKEIRKNLESKGYKFKTSGDTEVLLQGFIEYGEKVLDKLRGQFAFAVYDNEAKSLFIARDRIGIKPLYYSTYKNWIIFGSEIKAIELSKESGAKRAVPLAMSVPSHSQLMKPASVQFAEELSKVQFNQPKTKVIQNYSVDHSDEPEVIKNNLVSQLYNPVRWNETMSLFNKNGISSLIECGPGKVLTGLIKRKFKDINPLNLDDFETLSNIKND